MKTKATFLASRGLSWRMTAALALVLLLLLFCVGGSSSSTPLSGSTGAPPVKDSAPIVHAAAPPKYSPFDPNMINRSNSLLRNLLIVKEMVGKGENNNNTRKTRSVDPKNKMQEFARELLGRREKACHYYWGSPCEYKRVDRAPCDSPIYCIGDVLHTIQTSGIFNDSKTFVDMPLRYSEAVALDAFYKLPNPPSREDLIEYIDQHFLPAGTELEVVEPEDWKPNPEFLNKISSESLRVWAHDLHNRWHTLTRRFNHDVSCKDCFSSILLPYPFVIPGGRFREIYYWDAFWILEGLLVSGMDVTAKGILKNFLHLVETQGFIPNGARIYYLNRSQPPLLTRMLWNYYLYTEDIEFLETSFPTLEAEYAFWKNNRTAILRNPHTHQLFKLSRYSVGSDVPRPESYL